ncbi:MAG TPA: choice-of-anchor Q domain-containing protein [Solirubrobacteraceae bacterium]|nr:choice-of-anchor Q domain-containing protein [Solirubrobacteraceae bacterium]
MRRRLAITVVAAAFLAVPGAAAQAASYTVRSGGGICGGGDIACGSVSAAAKAMRAGDDLTISPGRYQESPRFEAPELLIRGSKIAPGVVIEGTVTFAATNGGASVLEKLVVRTSAAGAGAVLVTGLSGVSLRDASLFSADGNALTITAATESAVTRSRLLAGAAAVAIGGGALRLDSSILSGGAGAGGIGIAILAVPQEELVLPLSVVARHVTIAGAPIAIAMTGSGDPAPSAKVSDSIVLGAAEPAVAFTRTDRESDPAALFVNPQTRNFRLRSGSPALDRGQTTPGESSTDIDGQPRTLGKASDLGADELDTVAPRVTITRPRGGQTLGADSRLRLAGQAQDPSGVTSVVFSLEVLPRSGATCNWFDPVRALVNRSCSDPVLVRAPVAKGGAWSFNGPPGLALPAGRYRVSVSGTDRFGVTGNTAPAALRTIAFSVRRSAAVTSKP